MKSRMLTSRQTASRVASLGTLGDFESKGVGIPRSKFSLIHPEKNLGSSDTRPMLLRYCRTLKNLMSKPFRRILPWVGL